MLPAPVQVVRGRAYGGVLGGALTAATCRVHLVGHYEGKLGLIADIECRDRRDVKTSEEKR